MKSLPADSVQKAIRKAVHEAEAMLARLPDVHSDLRAIASACAHALENGHKVLFCGNGGSAAESQHLATEFVVRLSSVRERKALPALALTTDTSLLTACGNDYGFDRIFARQVEAHMTKGDVLILLSTSGKSPNQLFAAKEARESGGVVIGFLGESKTPLDEYCDYALHIPSPASQRVQEGHLMCGHLLVELVEGALFDD